MLLLAHVIFTNCSQISWRLCVRWQ